MAEKNIGLLEAIDIAMDAEMKAHKFYADAVKKVSNERGKNLLQQLAQFEQNHYDKLAELKDSLNKNGKYIAYEGTTFEPFDARAYSGDPAKIEENKADVLDILVLAIDAETEAHEHYKGMAETTADPDGKSMFEKLADEETLHRRILSDEFYSISNKDGVWAWGE